MFSLARQKNFSRQFISALLLLIALPVAPVWSESSSEKPRGRSQQVVAEIDDYLITDGELNRELKERFRAEIFNIEESSLHRLRRQVLESLITRYLLSQAALASGIKPTNEEVESRLAQIKVAFVPQSGPAKSGKDSDPELIAAEYEKQLAAAGISEAELRNQVYTDIAINRLFETRALSNIRVSESEIDAALKKESKVPAETEVRVRQILIRVPEDAPETVVEEKRLQAESILEQVRESGADFAALAKVHSEGAGKGKGGDLGYVTRNQLHPAFSEVAFKLEPGEISDLVKTPLGFHIIKVEARRQADKPDPEKERARLRKLMLRERQEKAKAQLIAELRNKARVIVYIN